MLTPQDDFIGHQSPTTFDHVDSSDPAWMERLWYAGSFAPAGEIIFDLGLGYHPNRNVMDGFAGVTVGNQQYNFRVSRKLRPHPLTTEIGPLKFIVIEGLRRHRIVLEENPSGISFDMEYIATMNPHEEEPHFRRRNGRVTENLMRVQQFGAFKGWLKVAGKKYEVTPDTWLGQRDHSWGIRAEMRTDETRPPMTFYPPLFWNWGAVQFEGYGLQWYFNERAPGDFIYITGEEVLPIGPSTSPRRDRSRLITNIVHDWHWADDPLGQTLDHATLNLTFASGQTRRLELRGLPSRYYLKGGLYGGYMGWAMGDEKAAKAGEVYMEHDVWDLGDRETRRRARTLGDHVIEVRDGDKIGHGIIEYGVASGYPKYENMQQFPGM